MNITAFGEILFDKIGDTSHLGGAPSNFISHIASFNTAFDLGIDTYLISAVGDDSFGKEALDTLAARGVQTKYIYVNPSHQTGVVHVTTDAKGTATYDIVEHVAYDHILFPGEAFLQHIDLFYMGTLAQRYAPNKKLIERIMESDRFLPKHVFTDLNLRQDFYSLDTIDNILIYTNFLKINQEEALILKNEIFAGQPIYTDDELIEFLFETYKINQILLTKAEKGASLYTISSQMIEVEAQPVHEINDTIGAGDAMSAICALGTMLKWQPGHILKRGSQFAGEICKIKGSIPENLSWYRQFESWFI